MNKINLINLLPYLMMTSVMIIIINSPYIHPTHLTLMLILFSLSVCMSFCLPMKNSMLSIILFMIMISGVLIIFLYFSSLISNEQSKMKMEKLYIYVPIMMIIIFSLPNHFSQVNSNNEINMLMSSMENMFSNIKMIYEYPFSNLSIKCMMFLLLTMFSIMKITSLNSTTLRKII